MSYNASNLEYSLIENSDLVVITEVNSINISLAEALSAFVGDQGAPC
jgi:hypothetical protein